MKDKGASALDATAITKGLILFGVGATGLHIHEDYDANKPAQTPQQILKETAARNRAAQALRAKH
jgi:hypothetical protein